MLNKYGVPINQMELTWICIVESVVHYDFHTSHADECEVGRYLGYPNIYIPATKEVIDKALEINPLLRKVVCASGDKFISSKEWSVKLP